MNRTSILYRLPGYLRKTTGFLLVVSLTAGFCSFADGLAIQPSAAEKTVIVIDPGHGGVDGGTSVGDLLEKDVNLAISLKLKPLLEQKGYTVVQTRETDVSLDNLNQSSSSRHLRDLNARVGIINSSGARLFLSIHVNSMASESAEDGSIVFYGKKLGESRVLAHYIQTELNSVKAGGAERRQNDPLPGRFYLLNGTYVPGVLIETAYMTNPAERSLLATGAFQDQLAQAIAAGTQAFLRSESE